MVRTHLFFEITPGWRPATERLITIQSYATEGETRFPVPLHHNRKERQDTHTHTLKTQTDASVEHLGCYLRRISPHKGAFIGLPSICGVQEQTLESSDRWWSYRGRAVAGKVVVVERGWRWWRERGWLGFGGWGSALRPQNLCGIGWRGTLKRKEQEVGL